MLHNASLMVDDIEDNSVMRRGVPVTHSVYGVPRTINSANYIYFRALEKCNSLQHPHAVIIFTGKFIFLAKLFYRTNARNASRARERALLERLCCLSYRD